MDFPLELSHQFLELCFLNGLFFCDSQDIAGLEFCLILFVFAEILHKQNFLVSRR